MLCFPLLSAILPAAMLATTMTGPAPLAAPHAGAARAGAFVVDRTGDVDVVTGHHPDAPDVTAVHYRASKTTLRVTIHADHLRGEHRTHGHEDFSVAVYPGGLEHVYTVHATRAGHLRLLNVEDGAESRIGGSLTVRPGRDAAVFRIPMHAIGNPAKVAAGGAAYLGAGNLEGWGEVWSLDFSKKGATVVAG